MLVETAIKTKVCQRLGDDSNTGEFNSMVGFHLEIIGVANPKHFFPDVE